MNQQIRRFQDIRQSIAALLEQDPKAANSEIKGRIARIDNFLKKLEDADAELARSENALAACKPLKHKNHPELSALNRRVNDRIESITATLSLIERLDEDAPDTERKALEDSLIEHQAMVLNLEADLIVAGQVANMRGKAQYSLCTLAHERAVRALDELLANCDIDTFAEKTVIMLKQRVTERQEHAERRAKAQRAANAATPQTAFGDVTPGLEEAAAEDVTRDPLPAENPQQPELDPALVMLVELEGLDPKNPEHVGLVTSFADPKDLEAARELLQAA